MTVKLLAAIALSGTLLCYCTGCAGFKITGGITTDFGTITSDGKSVAVVIDARQLGNPRGFAK